MIVKRTSDQLVISNNMKIASSFNDRLVGLMFKGPLKENDSLLINPCNSIHTFFMKYAIDVIFLNKKLEVVAIYNNLKPWRLTKIVFKASQVLEMEAGRLNREIKIGDKLEICTN